MSGEDVEDTSEIVSRLMSELRLEAEEALLDEETERDGCRSIFESLTKSELEQLPDANMVLRFFRGEKGKVKKALSNLQTTLKWRIEFGVEKIKKAFDENGDAELATAITEEIEEGKMYARGYDKTDSRVVVYVKAAKNLSSNQDAKMKMLAYNLERAIACSKNGKEKFMIIIDFTGYQLKHTPPLAEVRSALNILQDHYPERLHGAFLCDPPFLFRTFWALVQPFMDASTKSKVVFCYGESGYAKLQELCDLEKLESTVGGTADPPLRDFDSNEYLRETPFYKTFDET